MRKGKVSDPAARIRAKEVSTDMWTERETSFQEKQNEYKIQYQPCMTIKVAVLCGRNISEGWLHDWCDTPDLQVYLTCNAATGRKNFKTKVARDSKSPVWNETFTFVLRNGTEKATIKFDVRDDDRHLPDPHVGNWLFETDTLIVDKPKNRTVDLNQHGEIDIQLLKKWRTTPDCRMSLGLSDGERAFRIKRKPKTMKAMQRLLGMKNGPKSLQETPTVALAITGGGYRALAASCGAIEALMECDVKDTLMYFAGLSGSTWYISSGYQHKAFEDLDTVMKHHDWLRERSRRNLFTAIDLEFLMRYRKYRNFKIENGQKTTLVDFFGFTLGESFLDVESPQSTLSALKGYVDTADVPFPIMSCAHVRDNLSMSVFWDEVEVSPFEISFPSYGINIPTEHFNSRWANGILQQDLPEPSLHFMMGTCGCAFAIMWGKIADGTEARKDVTDYIETVYECHAMQDALNEDVFHEENESEDDDDKVDGPNVSTVKKRRATDFTVAEDNWIEMLEMKAAANTPLEEHHFAFGRDFPIERTAKVNNCAASFPKLQKFRFNTKPVDKNETSRRITNATSMSTRKQSMALCDSGIGCNLPAVHVLRPQRTVDIVLVVDCAPWHSEKHLDTMSFATVESQLKLHKLTFPTMSIEKIESDPFREIYLFEDKDNPDCPIVIWFTLANGLFRELENPPRRSGYPTPDPVDSGEVKFNDFTITPDSKEFATTRLSSDPLTFDRLRELMKFNIKTNASLIKDKIATKVEHLRKKK